MNYLQNLVDNHPKTNDVMDMDIVLESGAAAGGFQVGCLLYINSLEEKGILKINRISGSSIGAVVGFYYFTKSLQDFLEDYTKLRDCFKQKLNVDILKGILEEKINKLTSKELENLNERLHIVYHDVEKKEQTMINTFTQKKELLSSLLKSCHIPFLTSSSMFYVEDGKEFYDGGIPYIFPERSKSDKKILYVSICNYNKLTSLFSVKKELNPYGRVLEGALDAHNFFLYNSKVRFCSYINDWDMFDYFILRLKQLIFGTFFYIAINIYYILKFMYPFVSRFLIVQYFSPLIYNIYRDILLFYCL
jgi:hypothetical protein